MVTSFYIEQGYKSMSYAVISDKELFKIATAIGKDQFKLYAKCREYGVPDEIEGLGIMEYIAPYANLPTEDLVCRFYETTYEDNGLSVKTKGRISQSASGGGDYRPYREQICKAFAMLVMEECCKKGYNVNFGSC